ncbi:MULTISPECIES: LysR family transcriptional regulator [Pseudomonas]|jgi:DNA-binding transcriptional LysR family regulator|uniref:LysR family transcriptional regulator n=1 Tax=Pseudomonas chlororaphis TaxID=587753 RepID=A0AB34CC11_9PSED|nr:MULTISPECIES: LysR family transcriptional regulator [Pseudomonas]AMS13038.1 LysR family transcriptional regulator [Pseudomonas chlororaphis]AZD01476.1 Transcriptional regulator, LysR family [Pseudomonas chlororaphis subsp. chlororaphis]AZD15074.1 Transcriptional regulator, LysR family [Pseudomonas chlororaphis]KAA5843619.1 LysR family transcriptional regulator [Pseudomonas chlororaphis]MBM0285158.1 LysR family transcriptional regulator [Pseudomonas chlororaphis]
MSEPVKPLDIDTVHAFVLIADFGSFTRAAQALDTSQAAISLKLKRLEERLGYRLLERTPRHVRLTPVGEQFMQAARDLLRAHERALGDMQAAPARRLIIGISDHVAGAELPHLLSRIAAYDPLLIIEVRIASSRDLTAAFDREELDAVIVRNEGARQDGEVLVAERFGWFAAPAWQQAPGTPLRLATMAAPCGVRHVAVRVLDDAGIAWTEVFIGGGVMAVCAAVSAGLGVAALAHRVAPAGAVEVGERLGLPVLPVSEIILLARPTDARSEETLRALSAAFRGTLPR